MAKKELLKQFGLVGKNIEYSFSKSYFSKKFEREKKKYHRYVNYDIKNIKDFKKVLKSSPTPSGLNVTIPYKKSIIPYLDKLSKEAMEIQAVNTIVWGDSGKIIGHNTDHLGFKKALMEEINSTPKNALILGTGGASKAVKYVLSEMGCKIQMVSRNPKKDELSYSELTKKIFDKTNLIVNATPLGTFPNVKKAPPIFYEYLNSKHFLFDLIYNPEETEFLKRGKFQGSQISNGYKMLIYQAEKSWELWTQ